MAETEPRALLDFFRGVWTLVGHESTYRERCDWLPGRGFVSCDAQDRSGPEPDHARSIFGYSEADGCYTYDGFGGSGNHRRLHGHLHDGLWRFHGQSERGPNRRRWQVTITPTATGFHFREEVSDRSEPWRLVVELEYLRLPDPSG